MHVQIAIYRRAVSMQRPRRPEPLTAAQRHAQTLRAVRQVASASGLA